MNGKNIEQKHMRLVEEITNLINNDQISPELLLQKIEEYQALQSEYASGNNIPEGIVEIIKNTLLKRCSSDNEAIDRQSLSVQIKQVGGVKTTIKDEKIKHTNNGGLHSEIEQAIVISCEGKRIDANHAQGICEVTGKLAQRALSCRRCHRSICLRHCEFIEQDGAHYPYCNTPPPRSRISCVKKTILSIDTWREIEKQVKTKRYH